MEENVIEEENLSNSVEVLSDDGVSTADYMDIPYYNQIISKQDTIIDNQELIIQNQETSINHQETQVSLLSCISFLVVLVLLYSFVKSLLGLK